MILVDASVWIDHIRSPEPALLSLLNAGGVFAHPFVIGEVALGHIRTRALVLADLRTLPFAAVATDDEVLQFIDRFRLPGLGIGYVDAHLLASSLLTLGSALWTRDKRLRAVAEKLGIAAKGLT